MNKEKALAILSGVPLALELFAVNASAYIDTSATTYGLQIGAGAVIVIGVAAVVIVMKIKKKSGEKSSGAAENKDSSAPGDPQEKE